MIDIQAISMTDQLTAAVREVCKEKGYEVEVSIAVVAENGTMKFNIDPLTGTKFSQTELNEIIKASLERIGGTII